MSKAAMNLQDSFLNQVRRENSEVRVLLVNGTLLRGIVKGFDNFTLILNNRNGQHLVYKHAIAQIVSHRPHARAEDMLTGEDSPLETSGETLLTEGPSNQDAGTEQLTKVEPANRRDAQPRAPRKERSFRPKEASARSKEQLPTATERVNESNAPAKDNAPRKDQPAKAAKDRPKKEGFNTLDLSSVKLGEKP